MKFRNPLPLLIRAAFGGAIIGFIVLVASTVGQKLFRGYVVWGHAYFILGLPVALGIGALIGGLIGTLIWMVSVISGRTFGIVGRAVIGVVSALFIVTVTNVIYAEEPGYYHPAYSWWEHAVRWFVYGVVLGLLPGIMARDKPLKLMPAAPK